MLFCCTTLSSVIVCRLQGLIVVVLFCAFFHIVVLLEWCIGMAPQRSLERERDVALSPVLCLLAVKYRYSLSVQPGASRESAAASNTSNHAYFSECAHFCYPPHCPPVEDAKLPPMLLSHSCSHSAS